MLTSKQRILRRTRLFGGKAAAKLEAMVTTSLQQMPGLDEESKYDLTLRVYDLLQYENASYAQQYLDRVRSVYRRDNPAQQYAATRAVIWNLAKAMLIKDEMYVSYLLTRYEKKQRDILKYRVDVANGDRIVYRHHTSPESPLPGGRRLGLKFTTQDWMLKLVGHGTFMRNLPSWHRREKGFRDWYVNLLDRVNLSDPVHYNHAISTLRCLEDVSGYREVRYPKMDRAIRQVEELLAHPPRVEVEIRRDVLQRASMRAMESSHVS